MWCRPVLAAEAFEPWSSGAEWASVFIAPLGERRGEQEAGARLPISDLADLECFQFRLPLQEILRAGPSLADDALVLVHAAGRSILTHTSTNDCIPVLQVERAACTSGSAKMCRAATAVELDRGVARLEVQELQAERGPGTSRWTPPTPLNLAGLSVPKSQQDTGRRGRSAADVKTGDTAESKAKKLAHRAVRNWRLEQRFRKEVRSLLRESVSCPHQRPARPGRRGAMEFAKGLRRQGTGV